MKNAYNIKTRTNLEGGKKIYNCYEPNMLEATDIQSGTGGKSRKIKYKQTFILCWKWENLEYFVISSMKIKKNRKYLSINRNLRGFWSQRI